jgi:hypothetical protein
LSQVSVDEWGRNDNFVCCFIVPAESAKMARKLIFGNYEMGAEKKLNSFDKVI